MSCICIAIIVVYLLFLPPLLLSGSPDDRCRCPFDRLLRGRPYPYRRASRQAEPLHLSLISSIFLYYSVALSICYCYVTILFDCIACLCRHLLYLLLSYVAYIIVYIYSAVSPAPLLVNKIR